jgi:hypothetical protein
MTRLGAILVGIGFSVLLAFAVSKPKQKFAPAILESIVLFLFAGLPVVWFILDCLISLDPEHRKAAEVIAASSRDALRISDVLGPVEWESPWRKLPWLILVVLLVAAPHAACAVARLFRHPDPGIAFGLLRKWWIRAALIVLAGRVYLFAEFPTPKPDKSPPSAREIERLFRPAGGPNAVLLQADALTQECLSKGLGEPADEMDALIRYPALGGLHPYLRTGFDNGPHPRFSMMVGSHFFGYRVVIYQADTNGWRHPCDDREVEVLSGRLFVSKY